MRPPSYLVVSVLTLVAQAVCAEKFIPQSNSSYIDVQGTAHITRVVPIPKTISPEAQKSLARPMSDSEPEPSIAEDRKQGEEEQERLAKQMQPTYPTTLTRDKIADVPVRVITPVNIPPENRDRVLLNVHGGGFQADWGSVSETVPIASLTKTKVVAVLYRLSPENPFPAAVDDTVAVYKELLKTYKPQRLVLGQAQNLARRAVGLDKSRIVSSVQCRHGSHVHGSSLTPSLALRAIL